MRRVDKFNLKDAIHKHSGFIAVLFLGTALRAYALWQTALINPDGALYIYQAKAMLAGHWDKLAGCGITYVSIYPFFIAGVQLLVGNWILSAQLVSMIFSTATLFPLYGLCRRFFDAQVSALAALIIALNPVMCSRSGDVVRGPVYWFFMATGLYLVIRFWDHRRTYRNLTFASCCFLLATWARIEAILAAAIAPIGVAMMGGKDLWRRLMAYGLPILVAALALLIIIFSQHLPMDRLLRLDQVPGKVLAFVGSYHQIDEELGRIGANQTSQRLRLFIPEAQNHIWLIAVGTMINRTLESFFYPFVPFFLIGLWRCSQNVRNDRRWWFLLLIAVVAYLLLYLHLLQVWIMEYRFLMLVMIPSIPFAGAGLLWVIETIESRWKIKSSQVVASLAILLLIAGLPKNLQPRDPDKIVFRQIAERIIAVNGRTEPVRISSSRHTHRLISLYTNINHPEPPCPEADYSGQWYKHADDLTKLARNLRRRGIRYFLYEERHWPNSEFTPEQSSTKHYFRLIGQWSHRDTGQLRLYQLR